MILSDISLDKRFLLYLMLVRLGFFGTGFVFKHCLICDVCDFVTQFCFGKSEDLCGFHCQTFCFAEDNSTVLRQSWQNMLPKENGFISRLSHHHCNLYVSILACLQPQWNILSVYLWAVFNRFQSETPWETMGQAHNFFRSCLQLIFFSLKHQAFSKQILQREIVRHRVAPST